MTRRHLILALIVVPILVVSGFYLRSLIKRSSFESHPKPEAEMSTQLQQQALQSGSTTSETVTLYFPNYATGELVGEAREMALAPNKEDQIRQIVLALVAGSNENHARALPPSTVLRAVFLSQDGTAYLDFSSDVRRDFPIGIESETLALRSVVDSIAAAVPQVQRVKFLVDGQEVDTLDGHADLTGFYTPDPSPSGAVADPTR